MNTRSLAITTAAEIKSRGSEPRQPSAIVMNSKPHAQLLLLAPGLLRAAKARWIPPLANRAGTNHKSAMITRGEAQHFRASHVCRYAVLNSALPSAAPAMLRARRETSSLAFPDRVAARSGGSSGRTRAIHRRSSTTFPAALVEAVVYERE